LSQEHGVLRSVRDLGAGELPIGSTLRVVPNHSCLAAALFDRYAVVRGRDVVAEWRPVRGW
jgi:D-serine deaminase-like pyridoxal phosphate-dependent protein